MTTTKKFVFPIKFEHGKNGKMNKIPVVKDWSDPDNCKHKNIKNLEGNWGMLTGKHNNLTVIDFDDPDFFKVVKRMIRKENPKFRAPLCRTLNGGYHMYVKYCPELNNSTRVITHNGEVKNVDFRNNGGYTVISPSKHEDRSYEWLMTFDEVEKLPEFPPVLYDMINERGFKKQAQPKQPKRQTQIKKEQQEEEQGQINQHVVLSETKPEETKRMLRYVLDEIDMNLHHYEDWTGVGMSLYNINASYVDLWDYFSKKRPMYDRDELHAKWKTFTKQPSSYNSNHLCNLGMLWKDVYGYFDLKNRYLMHTMRKGGDERYTNFFLDTIKYDVKIIDNKECYIYDNAIKLWEKRSINFVVESVGRVFEETLKSLRRYTLEVIKRLTEEQGKTWDSEEEAFFQTMKNAKEGNKYELMKEYYFNLIYGKGGIDIMIKSLTSSVHDDNILKKLKKRKAIMDPDFVDKINKISHLLPIKNNMVVNLKAGEARERTKEDRFTFACPVNLKPRESNFEHADRFFRDVANDDEEVKNYIIKRSGYFITGETDRKFDLVIGEGMNGKSGWADILNAILTDNYYSPLAKDILIHNQKANPSSSSASPHLMALKTARLGVFTETKQGECLNGEFLKSLTGGDKISARELYKSQTSFKSRTKILLLTNSPPNLNAVDTAMRDRLSYLPFFARFEFHPTKGQKLRDPEFMAKLQNEYLDEIFSYIVYNGSYEYYKNPEFVAPKVIAKEQQQYLDDNDIVTQFINSNIIKTSNEKDRIKATDMFDEFKYWCKNTERNFETIKANVFGSEMRKRGLQVKKLSSNYYVGVRIGQPDDDDDADYDHGVDGSKNDAKTTKKQSSYDSDSEASDSQDETDYDQESQEPEPPKPNKQKNKKKLIVSFD